MKKSAIFYLLVLVFVFMSYGCVVRTYPLVKDRVDQNLSTGNRGYLSGPAPELTQERKTTRRTQVVEIELRSPVKFERKPSRRIQKTATEDNLLVGNRGFIYSTQKSAPELTYEQYTVQRNDTLQKISKKFYGTTKKWMQIYEANKDVLKTPNRVYPKQILRIPLDALRETKENLK